ncbi:hypothetical protein pclt_cds_72 [Pandoravirus celtis]|uniref:Uncharacterized protein n=1 Tax=Pandoravirus celtis TaxID=2568002 RepID=A0A4D6EFK7_9VIRU|nr:hypothetical protein pclt_cds_72 [Pandoravirus celtis]
MLTGVNVPWKTYVESPTTPAILNGGALSKWCRPNNFTGGASGNVYCSGPGSFTWMQMLWIQLIKVGGLGSNYIYNNDRVIIHSSLNNSNCTLVSNVLNCETPDPAPSLSPSSRDVSCRRCLCRPALGAASLASFLFFPFLLLSSAPDGIPFPTRFPLMACRGAPLFFSFFFHSIAPQMYC